MDLQHPPQEQNSTWQKRCSRGENLTMPGIKREARTHWLLVLEIRALKLCELVLVRPVSAVTGPLQARGLDHHLTMVWTTVRPWSGLWSDYNLDHGPTTVRSDRLLFF